MKTVGNGKISLEMFSPGKQDKKCYENFSVRNQFPWKTKNVHRKIFPIEKFPLKIIRSESCYAEEKEKDSCVFSRKLGFVVLPIIALPWLFYPIIEQVS